MPTPTMKTTTKMSDVTVVAATAAAVYAGVAPATVVVATVASAVVAVVGSAVAVVATVGVVVVAAVVAKAHLAYISPAF